MTLEEQMKQNPWNWKDTVAAITLSLTVGAVFVQGGQVIERLDATNKTLGEMKIQMSSMQAEQGRLATMQEALRGSDRLHDEQITTIRRDLEELRKHR